MKLTCWEKELLRILRLTLTWDVLKLIFSCRHIKHPLGLTLTWDVLKLHYLFVC